MPFRFRTLLITLSLLVLSCGNEPYDTGTISVISIKDTKLKILYTYQYRQSKLYLFKATSSTDGKVLAWSKFYYDMDLLDRIISDSATEGYFETHIKRVGSKITEDSTRTVRAGTSSILSKRLYEYEGERLIAVMQKEWRDTLFHENKYEFTWQDGNLTQTVLYNITNGISEQVGTTAVEFDKKNNVYNNDLVFVYTMPLPGLYWLSKNNPVLIKETNMPDLKLKYVYNKFQYPSLYKIEADGNTEFAISYTELR